MKISVSLATFEAPPGMPVLFSGDLKTNIPKIKQLGYDGVDLFIHDPRSEESRLAQKLLKENHLGVGVVMPAALAGQGLFLGDLNAEVRQEIIIKLKEIIEFAAEVGGMVSLGLVRGNVKAGDNLAAFLKRFADSCNRLLPTAVENHVPLLVEPINRYEINTLNSSSEAYEFIEKAGLNLFLMLDTFHMNIEDVSLTDSITKCAPLIKHIHFLDSNRLAPGMGHLNMTEIYETLLANGYDGYLCLEALPIPSGLICARRGIKFFKELPT
jgi:sugar phosphate isomerase/epimerase